jgi:hypothetical protein
MRKLTFTGYLESYVEYLSGEHTLALPRLVTLMCSEPRLVEPMLLWAALTGRHARLNRLLEGRPDLLEELCLLRSLTNEGRLEGALAAPDPRLRPEYGKAWRSYVARRDAPARDARLKLEARERVLALEAQRHVSRYRMAKDLGLNPGNLHAFLSQGKPGKLSLDRAYELVRYLEVA